jgi:flagellar motor component MotA
MPAADADRHIETLIPAYRNRNLLSALVGVVGFFCVWGVTVALLEGGSTLMVFMNLPSMLLVLLAPLVVLTGIYGWAGVVDAWAWVFRKPRPADGADDAVTFFQLAAGFALVSGFLATVIGLILSLRYLSDPRQAGQAMGVALLSQLYGVFLSVLYVATAAYIARRHHGVDGLAPLARRAASVAGLTTIAGVLTAMVAFGILMLSISPCF